MVNLYADLSPRMYSALQKFVHRDHRAVGQFLNEAYRFGPTSGLRVCVDEHADHRRIAVAESDGFFQHRNSFVRCTLCNQRVSQEPQIPGIVRVNRQIASQFVNGLAVSV